jgi:hypothetical protein
VLCRYMSGYNETIWKYAKRVLRYLKGTANFGLVYHAKAPYQKFSLTKPTAIPQLEVYSDSDHAGREYDSKSTTGHVSQLGDAAGPIGTVGFKSSVQRTVATSTTQAEWNAADVACREAVWQRGLLGELKMTQAGPTTIWIDNQSTIKLAENPVMHSRTKHFRVRQHYIQELIKNRVVRVAYLSTDQMLADLLNKPFPGPRHAFLRDGIMGRQQSRPSS